MNKKILLGLALVAVGAWFAPNSTTAASYPDGTLIGSNKHPAVYLIDGGKRHAFINESIYKTWYADFSGVKGVTVADVESYELGTPVPIKPNTKLIKFPLNPKIYAVVENATLRYIPDPAVAVAVYGANWESKIIEVPEVYYLFYAKGAALSTESSAMANPPDYFGCPPGMMPQSHQKFGFGVCYDPAGGVLEANDNLVVFTMKTGGALSTYPGKVKFVTNFSTVDAYINSLDFGIQQGATIKTNSYGVESHSFGAGTVDSSGYHVIIQNPTTKKIYHFEYSNIKGIEEAATAFTNGLRDTFRFLN